MNLKKFLILLLITCCSVLPASTGNSYKIGMIHWIAYSPLNVAQVKGFFAAEGLEVDVINFGSNQELNGALEHGRIDIALDMIGSWVGMYQDGVPLTILCETDWSHGGDKIIAKHDVDMATLKGSKIGVYLNKPSVTFFLNHYLAAHKLKLSDVSIIEVEPEAMSDNFIADRFKVIVNYDPQALRAEREGNGRVVATSKTYPGCIPEGFVARTDRIKEIPEEHLAGVFRAWNKAVSWSKDKANWQEYKKILNENTFEGEAAYSDQDLQEMLSSVSIHNLSELRERNGSQGGLNTYLADLKAFLVTNGKLKRDFDPKVIFQNGVISEVLKK